MSRLVRSINDTIEVAQGRVYHADYGIIYVANVTAQTTLPHGWTYYEDDIEVEDFVHSWKQPEGAHDAYEMSAIVTHSGQRWRSIIKANVWEPGVTGWLVMTGSDVPAWIQPTGAHDAYSMGAVVTHGTVEWVSELDANVWEPGVAGWRRSMLEPPPPYDPNAVAAWVQSTGAHDAYQLGDRVTHNEQTWVSTVDANTWEPGVFGWTAE